VTTDNPQSGRDADVPKGRNARRREPAPGIFRLVLPLPFPGLDRVNAYLLADESNGAVLVDCGILDPAKPEGGWSDLADAFNASGIEPGAVTRLVVTHPHIDHYGMAGRFLELVKCDLWMHEDVDDELDMYRHPDKVAARLREMFGDHGVEEDQLDELTAYEDWRHYLSSIAIPTELVADGRTFDVGSRTWRVVHTPGHSKSHICLFSESDGILISGDHLLPAITPHIDFKRGLDGDPLGEFLASLRKVEQLAPDLVFPGHGRPFEEGAERARVNIRHHDRRLGSILQIIRREPHTASEITDEIWGGELLNFQRRLALGEALAHLAYLVKQGDIERLAGDDGTYLYKKVARSAPAL
jgi:glyoxylase-like metal-dependent hydrolase (beta-lactamase superfamily II)